MIPIHPIHRVTSFQHLTPHTLRVQFDDQTEQVINFEPVLAGELFRPLRDLALFKQVRIDPEVHTLVWPKGADFDPATLHDWPQYVEALTVRASMRTDTCRNDPQGQVTARRPIQSGTPTLPVEGPHQEESA